ncbi:2,3-bisphosphoglycerate-independent phosphoglycerate mutase [bioreactor metagenome]|uniref:2,3-bisphosphoglycerate-independent phosphoglycerate mutase n=1 Tax=bioreactor metagenome TaxID=1076179 RepID=A0A645FYB8_9ZZZZ
MIATEAKKDGYTVIITADHGNCDEMLDEKGNVLTQHSTNLVPFILLSADGAQLNRDHGIMADVAPTLLHLLGLPQPVEMTGKSLV